MCNPPETMIAPVLSTVPGWQLLQALAVEATPVWLTEGGKPWQLPHVAAVGLFQDQVVPTDPVKPTPMGAPWQ
jgi:hypothetical protein